MLEYTVRVSYRSTLASAILLAAAGNGLAADDIQTYTVPKEHPAAAVAVPATVAGAPDIPVNAAPIHWSVPDGWQELAPTSIRLGNFLVAGQNGKKAEVTVTSFPGAVGTELDNVNRWRREVGMEPVTQINSGDVVTVDGSEGRFFDLAGPVARTLVAMVSRNGATWFFKMRGDTEVVAAARPAFADFLKSVRFGGIAPEARVTAPVSAPAAPLPEAGAAPGSPQWEVPAGWTETDAGPMILKKFSIAGQGEQKAFVSISSFPGDVGGVFANVNRWRGQLGLPPVEADKLAEATQTLETAGGKATMVDFTGTDGRTGRASRLVGAIVPHGDQTWFYKLTGDAPLVGPEKESFVRFVKGVRYP